MITGIFFGSFMPNAVNLTVIGILIVALAIPWRFFMDYLGWLGIPVVMVILELLHPPHWQRRDIDYSFGFLFLVFEVGMLIVAAILLKAIVHLAWSKWLGVPVFAEFLPRPGRKQATQRRALALCWGVITAFLAYLMIRRMLGGSHPPFAYTSMVILMASLWVLPWARARWRSRPDAGGFSIGRAFLVSFRWSMLVVVVLGAGLAGLVAREAGELAGDQPHCIQVADSRHSYRQATTLLDLSALTMKARGGSHALLVVGDGPARRVFNWSYRQLGFDELPPWRNPSGYEHIVVCEPRPGFLANLPVLFADAAD